jgi:hypothetical protein
MDKEINERVLSRVKMMVSDLSVLDAPAAEEYHWDRKLIRAARRALIKALSRKQRAENNKLDLPREKIYQYTFVLYGNYVKCFVRALGRTSLDGAVRIERWDEKRRKWVGRRFVHAADLREWNGSSPESQIPSEEGEYVSPEPEPEPEPDLSTRPPRFRCPIHELRDKVYPVRVLTKNSEQRSQYVHVQVWFEEENRWSVEKYRVHESHLADIPEPETSASEETV